MDPTFPKKPIKRKLGKEVAALDRAFKMWIRLSKSDEHGVCECITCGRRKMWNDCDSGHYVNSGKMATRWDSRNVFPQCRKCNRFEEGQQHAFAIALNKIYGQNMAELLIYFGNTGAGPGREEMKLLAKHYRSECKKIRKDKGL